MNKIKKLIKSNFKRKLRITQGLLVAFLLSGILVYGEDAQPQLSPLNITINNLTEKTGLELGDKSYPRGEGSITTSRNGIAIGNGAVATGGAENKESIITKLAENKTKLDEIAKQQKLVNQKTQELRDKQIRERATIEAGIRVEEILKSKEKAKVKWQEDLKAYNDLKNNSEQFFRDYNSKINDLNSRLSAISQIQGIDLNSEDGLNSAASQLKSRVENGTTLNLSEDFYKEYARNYYRALGDLRLAKIKKAALEKGDNFDFFKEEYNKKYNDKITKEVDFSFKTNFYNNLLYNNDSRSFSNGFFLEKNEKGEITFGEKIKPFINDVQNSNENRVIIPIIDENSVLTKDQYEDIQKEIRKLDNFKEKIIEQYTDGIRTFDIVTKEEFSKGINYIIEKNKFEFTKKIDKAFFQGEYERTKNTTWLDKKKAVDSQTENNIEGFNEYSKIIKGTVPYFYNGNIFYNSLLNQNYNKIPRDSYELLLKEWAKKNITDIEEKNKLTINTLTNELEQALGINKQAIQQREAEINRLKSISEQDEKNYNGLNPSEADKILAAEYIRVKEEINKLTNEIVTADTKLKALKEALTLNDLTNMGSNNFAIGTNSLAVKDDAIALGTSSSTIGEQSISIGKEATTVGNGSITISKGGVTKGNNSINIGTGNVLIGDKSGVLGDPNQIFGNNNFVVGNENKIGTVNAPKNNVFILGSNINAENIDNAIILGNESQGVSGAVSVGKPNAERKILNVADGLIASDSKEVINGSQIYTLKEEISGKANKSDLNTYIKIDGSNIDNSNKSGIISKLSDGANISTPTNSIITDSKLKEVLDNKNYVTNTDLSNKANKDLTNVTKESIVNKASDGASLTSPTNSLVTDTLVKTELDKKADKNNVFTKEEINNKLDSKANTSDLSSYAKTDASNINTDNYINKLNSGANISTPLGKLVTDRDVKNHLDSNYYDKSTIDNKLLNANVRTEGSVKSNSLEVTNGTNRLVGTQDLIIELKNNSISKEKLSTEIKTEINNKADKNSVYSKTETDNKFLDKSIYDMEKRDFNSKLDKKANINGDNITSNQNKADFRKNIEVYSKNEIDNRLSNLDVTTNLNGKITETEEAGVKGKVIHEHLINNYVNKKEIEMRDAQIISNYQEIQENKQAIANNSKRIEQVNSKVNKIGAMTGALGNLDFGQVKVNHLAVGAGIASFNNAQAIAVGVAYRPTENLFMTTKYSIAADNPRQNSAIGAGITYQFNLND